MSFGFGSTANTTSQAGTLFGANNNTSAGTLFGANTSNASAAGTLFGGPAANTGFGGFSKPATTSAFGATTSQPAAAPATTGFGGFGANATSTGSGFGGFGQQSQAPSAFGQQSQAPMGFGQQSQAPTGFGQQSQAPTGFGQQAQAPTGFGQQTQATTGFGQPAATSTGFGQPSTGFGQPAASTGFGQPAATAGFGFGAKPAFGATTNNLFGNNQQQQQQQQQQMGGAPVQEKVWQDLALIRAHFDPTSPLCQFRHYFYNMVPTNEAHLYVRPQNQDENLWNEAVRKNPDPTCLVPVLAVGFDDILKRIEIQSKQVEIHQETLKETANRLATVQRQYDLSTLVRLEEHKRRHANLAQRLLRLLRYSQVLRYKGFPLNSDEEQAIKQLSNLVSQPNQPPQLAEKMNQLYRQLQAIKAQRLKQNDQPDVWRTVRERDAAEIAQILDDEQKGIMYVTSMLKSDAKELEVIEVGLKDNGRSMSY
ncbi:nucleoporin complex subunit 54-domain-containing protein [Mucor mucedo]|uniref:nucleoporin complex subunit 54-domain-containing protein n=1 Tax=Mucor mucedo TaxID=29922 RepID=UPI0022204311|nr:nucleoporin complex subunit 54-domain-containing protein [Mucor mucedo]KAI7890413.1 nucleoporin complex subunit 54-domain-containing protein [Mucor mucedo]